MTSVVLDTSAVLALVRDEPGADKVARHVGRAAISAVNLQELIRELRLSGLDEGTTRELIDELRLDVRAHDVGAAYAAAALHAQTRQYGRGLGDRSCLALAVLLGVPALSADREWKMVRVRNLKVKHIRSPPSLRPPDPRRRVRAFDDTMGVHSSSRRLRARVPVVAVASHRSTRRGRDVRG